MNTPTYHEARKRGLLSKMELFEDMTHEDVETISAQLEMFSIPKDKVIYHSGTDDLYLLKKGRVKLIRTTYAGEETLLGYVEAGHMFGMTALLGQARDNDMAIAVEDCDVCRTTTSAFLTILSRHPKLMARMMIAMAKRIFVLESTVEELVSRPVRSRVARCLLVRAGESLREHDIVPLQGVTRREIADDARTTRESVSRCLREFAELGAVEFDGRTILVSDGRLLAELARQGDAE